MAFSLNRVTLIGNLGADPELKSTPQGTQVCSVNIATTERYKDKSGEWKDSTEWHKVVFWDKLAETVNEYLKKGSKIYVEGKLKYRQYEKEGVTRFITEIYAQSMIMLSKREDGASAPKSQHAEESFDESAINDSSQPDDDIPF